jgi:hypothetical protein
VRLTKDTRITLNPNPVEIRKLDVDPCEDAATRVAEDPTPIDTDAAVRPSPHVGWQVEVDSELSEADEIAKLRHIPRPFDLKLSSPDLLYLVLDLGRVVGNLPGERCVICQALPETGPVEHRPLR